MNTSRVDIEGRESGFISMPANALKVGDTVQVWWGTKRATVSGFRSHSSGQGGWTVADFTDGFSMTVTPIDVLKVAPCGT